MLWYSCCSNVTQRFDVLSAAVYDIVELMLVMCLRLCLSISDFHPDTWNPAWSVSTILTGLLSFMVSVFCVAQHIQVLHFLSFV